MTKLTINLATRGRPDLLLDTIVRTLPNITHPDTTLMVSVDADDGVTLGMLQEIGEFDRRMLVSVKPREDGLGAKYNRCLTECPADVYLMMVDYAPIVTPSFDERVLEAVEIYPDGICAIYNRLANRSFPVVQGVSHRLAEMMGYIYQPYTPYWWVDHWLDDIAKMIGRIAYAEIQSDTFRRPGTQERRDVPFWADFFDRTNYLREKIALDIINCREFASPRWLKAALVQNFPLVRQASRAINAVAVRDGVGLSEVPDDARHQRLRAAAKAIVSDIDDRDWPTTRPLRHPQSVVIATPNLSHWWSSEFGKSALETQSVLAMCGVPHCFIDVAGNSTGPALPRNKLATAYNIDFELCENLLYIDDDVGWQGLVDKLLKILARPEMVIVGAYPRKTDPCDTVQYTVRFERDSDGLPIVRNRLLKVTDLAPGGFMRIKRQVIDMFAKHHGTFADRTTKSKFKKFINVFASGATDGEWVGEDASFVRRCSAMGIDVWCDPYIELTHRGSYVWKGCLADSLGLPRT